MNTIMDRPVLRILENTCIVVLFLLLVSAAWVEKDSYRYVAITLVLWGLVAYVRADFKPSIGWAGFACIGWASFVAIRYVLLYMNPTVRTYGGSEGIYLLPILYITVGYMMFRYWKLMNLTIVLFMLISLAMAAITLDGISVFDSEHHAFLMMKNTIHSSVGAGFLILAALNFSRYAYKHVADARRRYVYEAISYLIIALCFVGLYGAKSKGVWAAMAIALVAQSLLAIPRIKGARGWAAAGGFAAALVAFAIVLDGGIWKTLGPTYASADSIVGDMVRNGQPLDAVQAAIASGTVPSSMNIRLMLWSNALEVWSHNLLFGSGIAWKDLWALTQYRDVGFDLIHNGYLEIAVRYGLLGFAFYMGLYAWAVANVRSAYKSDLIPREAFDFYIVSMVFFLVTIFTNSNNRLAIGESYMMVAAAFGFCCFYSLQQTARQRVAVANYAQAGADA